jgi:hypothetical protein
MVMGSFDYHSMESRRLYGAIAHFSPACIAAIAAIAVRFGGIARALQQEPALRQHKIPTRHEADTVFLCVYRLCAYAPRIVSRAGPDTGAAL